MYYETTGTVFATLKVVGFHRWPEAPSTTAYLRNLHRHLFGIRVEMDVDHVERAVEYHHLQRWIHQVGLAWAEKAGAGEYVFHDRSCEAIALALLRELQSDWPNHALYRVTVDEDGENGSMIEARAVPEPHRDIEALP